MIRKLLFRNLDKIVFKRTRLEHTSSGLIVTPLTIRAGSWIQSEAYWPDQKGEDKYGRPIFKHPIRFWTCLWLRDGWRGVIEVKKLRNPARWSEIPVEQ